MKPVITNVPEGKRDTKSFNTLQVMWKLRLLA
jgi:hypothetical protein